MSELTLNLRFRMALISAIIAAPFVTFGFASSADAVFQETSPEQTTKPLGYSIGVSIVPAKSKTSGDAHRITAISPSSPANDAGLLPDDYILSIDKIRTGETRSLNDLIQNSEGKKLEIIVERDGKRKTFSVKPFASSTEIVKRRTALKPTNKTAKKAVVPNNPPKTTGDNEREKKDADLIPDVFDQLGDTNLLEKVTIHYIEELNIVTIRGLKADVEKVEKVIREFVKSAKLRAPKQEIIRLRNSWANRAAESLTTVYENQYANREGAAVITPMHNPEAIMVVGRQRAIDIVRSLAEAYDAKKPAEK